MQVLANGDGGAVTLVVVRCGVVWCGVPPVVKKKKKLANHDSEAPGARPRTPPSPV